MGRVNIVKQVKVDGKWILRSIPKQKSGYYDWAACQSETTSSNGARTDVVGVSQRANAAVPAMEEQQRKRDELEAHALGLAPRSETSEVVTPTEPASVRKLPDRYLDEIKTLKKPNTHRNYVAS